MSSLNIKASFVPNHSIHSPFTPGACFCLVWFPRTCRSTWVRLTCAFGFTVSSLFHTMFGQTTCPVSPTPPKTRTSQYLRRSSTPQPQVKHAARTRAQPGLRGCQTELTAKREQLDSSLHRHTFRQVSMLPIPNVLLKQAQPLSKCAKEQTLHDCCNYAAR